MRAVPLLERATLTPRTRAEAAIAQALIAGLGEQWTVEACAERCRRQVAAAKVAA